MSDVSPTYVEKDAIFFAQIRTNKINGRGHITVEILNKNKEVVGRMKTSAIHGALEGNVGYACFTFIVPAGHGYQNNTVGDVEGGVKIWPGL